MTLIKPLVFERHRLASLNNFSSLKSSLIESITRVGIRITADVNFSNRDNLSNKKKRGRCAIFKNNDNKYSNMCGDCKGFFCGSHSEKMTSILCKNCIAE